MASHANATIRSQIKSAIAAEDFPDQNLIAAGFPVESVWHDFCAEDDLRDCLGKMRAESAHFYGGHRLMEMSSTCAQDRQGSPNDVAVATNLLAELAGNGDIQAFASGLVLGFSGAHAARTRERIDDVWQKFRRQTPFWE